MKSKGCGWRLRKPWRLRVYVRQPVDGAQLRQEAAFNARHDVNAAGDVERFGVNVLKAKDRGWSERPGALTRVPSAAAAVKGLRFAPMNAQRAARP